MSDNGIIKASSISGRSRETHAYGTLLIRSSANSALLSELMSREAFEP